MARSDNEGSGIARGAAALGAAAAANHLLGARAERRHPPAGRLLTIGGIQVHAIEKGVGTPIVLLHGNGAVAEDFRISGLFDRLARHHRVIAFDRPGAGYTDRPRDRDWTAEAQAKLLAAAADALGVQNPIVVGHSFGTLVAIAWALARPGAVAALGLLGGYYFPTRRPDALLQKAVNLPGLGPLVASTLMPIQGRLTGPLGNRFVFSPAKPTDAYLDQTPFGLMLRPSQLLAALDDGAQLPGTAERLQGRYRELALPVLVAWGEGDRMVRQKPQSSRLAALLPDATSHCVPGAGHMLHHTDPDGIADAILALARNGEPEENVHPMAGADFQAAVAL